MNFCKTLSIVGLCSFLSQFAIAEPFGDHKGKNNYEDFPREESGILNWIGNTAGTAVTPVDVVDRSFRAFEALETSLGLADGAGLKYLIKKTDCIAWINLYRGSFLAGFRIGRGLVSCRILPESNIWSAPFYIRMGEISAGAQLGLDQSDYFLFFPKKETLIETLNGNMTLNGNVALTIAKWGRSASAGTDVDLLNVDIKKDVVYSYAISRGAYAGLSLEGGVLLGEPRYNATAYKDFSMDEILGESSENAPKATRKFSELLNKVSLPEQENLVERIQSSLIE